MANDTYEIQNLVIHGNIGRAKQLFYPNPVGKVPRDLIDYLEDVYPGINESQHYGGNPAFCMHLKLTDFFANHDGSIGFTVKVASLRSFPYGGQSNPNGQWGIAGPDTRFEGVTISPYNEPNIGYNSAPPYIGFGCPFNVNAALFSGKRKLTESTLFSKPTLPDRWEDGYAKLDNPIVLSGKRRPSEDKVVLAILMYSTCSCNQGQTTRPVFAADISEYIPKVDPYVWRRFGTSKSNDPDGYNINKDLLDGNWHLVRPFYYKSGNKWRNVEEENN